LVVEGPSGIGKTTAVENALIELNLHGNVTKLSARLPEDVEYINMLPTLGKVGTVVVDDFHKLPTTTRQALADYMKTLADRSSTDVKLIVVGINKAGESLIQFAHDLVNRLDVVPFESNPDHRVRELLSKGERALNITLNVLDVSSFAEQKYSKSIIMSLPSLSILFMFTCINHGSSSRHACAVQRSLSPGLVGAPPWNPPCN